MTTHIISQQPAKKPMPKWTDEPFVGRANAVVIHAHSRSEARSLWKADRKSRGLPPCRVQLVRLP